MTTFDFGFGPVSAHRHPNGGGWMAMHGYTGSCGQTVIVSLQCRARMAKSVLSRAAAISP